MLSPAESVGLYGSTLDNRVRKAVQRVGDGTLARISDRLRIDALAGERPLRQSVLKCGCGKTVEQLIR